MDGPVAKRTRLNDSADQPTESTDSSFVVQEKVHYPSVLTQMDTSTDADPSNVVPDPDSTDASHPATTAPHSATTTVPPDVSHDASADTPIEVPDDDDSADVPADVSA